VLNCPTCRKSICIECSKLAHEGQCKRTRRGDLKAVLNALKHEGAAMCPRCGFVAGREKDSCNQIICPKPCSQAFCFKCSRDWRLCKGMCKGGAAEVLERAAEEKSADSPTLEEDDCKGLTLVVEDGEIEEEGYEKTTKKCDRSPDSLFERFTKKTKVEIIEDDEDGNDSDVDLDISDDEDRDAHDDEEDDAGFDVEEDDYGYDDSEEGDDDGENGENDELEEDFE
jgi:hypothetical protein